MRFLFISLILILTFISCSDDDEVMMDIIPTNDELSLQKVATDSSNTMVWVPRANMKSRNGDEMGYGVNLNPTSDKLLIFLDGGGACFNELTCAFNLDRFSEEDFYERILNEDSLLLNQNPNDNQFASWNFVFVPYATGDVHSGSNPNANIPDTVLNNQVMNGFNNVSIILNDLNAYFDDTNALSEIVLAGSSAGGFGVMPNYFQLKDAFGANVPTTAIIDAGQIFLDQDILTPCLVEQWNNLWNLSNSLPDNFDMVINGIYDYDIQKVYEYSAMKYPNDNFGFLSYYEDDTNRFFYSFGQNDCSLSSVPVPVTGQDFRNGLLDLQNSLLGGLNNWKVFYKNGSSHVFLSDSELDQTIDGITLNDWILSLRQGNGVDLLE